MIKIAEPKCPNVSWLMIRVVLEGLREKGKIEVLGTGRDARWRKRDNNILREFLH
ncbi:MAG: hypothetical protein KAS66_10200 [Candidatus Omnitrophica bacterium]|nr:hypothetical protein [Candidatus Omnitrophota bacterium]